MASLKKVVISGATGSIGMALISYFIKKHVEVLVLYRNNSLRANRIPDHPLVTKEICSLADMSSFVLKSDNKYDVFYHFAWEGTFGDARNDMYLQNRNVQYTLDAVHLAKRLGCHTFIGAGSQAEYGRVEGKLTPYTPTFPENGYGIAKLCAGHMSRILCKQLGLRHIWTRILSVYGPMDNEYSLTMSTIVKLINGEQTHFTSGEQIWDFLYSEDAANAFYLIGEKGVNGKTYCLGSGNTCLLKDAVTEIINQINPSVKIGIGDLPYPPNQVMFLCADIGSLTADTGFVPLVTFKEGVRKTIEWYKKNNK
ncbi:NAD(P)-dependent oxidoreductase [Clostridiaceae bacterium UIB06]|uniref:NAD(P)-dependent oxidoreductase n=1 Tax=Clostridium thailandense TaxID=2794346 RepID=A0A949TLT8_9CLOT|nr:NAD(P)-dependent oxidoreductase [Clostridium thailandense]MBV7272807.1 NAD(P)-dependent oxidoreductase [Clostridium thailandense]MCH5137652.1 NAD(P)-dependent oxidoreductase [Clostridiaceae bacterium UIB06]